MTRISEGGGVIDDSASAIDVWAGDETATDADQAGFLARSFLFLWLGPPSRPP